MALVEWGLIAGIGLLVSFAIANSIQNNQQRQRLLESFYTLLETEAGRISLIQLAASARVEAEVARQFLDNQVKVFNALPEVDEDGNTSYCFPKLKRLAPANDEEW
ncbi:hypothetical protein [Pantanalinema sp. GBBB05]|uniref:hypothetical protein n=1 Tax=Pantanalinema sp. GBBB05 TaxID=2604139 RepID=UPI001D7001B7|nr:hypothetical protein [Pantanalinema sp. GBBB05]